MSSRFPGSKDENGQPKSASKFVDVAVQTSGVQTTSVDVGIQTSLKCDEVTAKPDDAVNGEDEKRFRKRVNPERFDPASWDVKKPKLTIEPVRGISSK